MARPTKLASAKVAMTMAAAVLLAAAAGSDDSLAAQTTEPAGETTEAPESSDTPATTGAPEPTDAPEAESSFVIGCITKNSQSEFWQAADDGCIAGGTEAGVEVLNSSPTAEADTAAQIALVEDMLAQGIDALVIAPSDPDALRPVLERAAAEIPVLLIDTDIPGWDGKTAYIGTDNFAAGRLAGEFMLDQTGGEGTVAIDRGLAGITSVDDRYAGFQDAIAGTGLIEVAALESGCLPDQGVSTTEDIFTSHPDIVGIFYVCDDPAVSGVAVMDRLGIDHEAITVIGFDAIPSALELVRAGKIDADVAQFPFEMGRLGIATAVRVLNGETVDAVIDSGVEMVTIDNVDQFLEEPPTST